MTLDRLITIADAAYYEKGLIASAYKDPGTCNDTLALFVARELKDTYDPNAENYVQVATAAQAMHGAVDDIRNIECALEDRLYE